MSNTETKVRRLTGFALMDRNRVKELGSQGGKKVQASGNARRWNSETASVASKKSHDNKKKSSKFDESRELAEIDVSTSMKPSDMSA